MYFSKDAEAVPTFESPWIHRGWAPAKNLLPKEGSNYHTTILISHATKVMLKILQDRLQQYMNQKLPDI